MFKKNGFTLVEIILAMAILAIVVVMMTPVLVSGFRQIVLSGERSRTGKAVVGAMEADLATGLVPTGNPTYQIQIGAGVFIDTYQMSHSQTGSHGTVNIDGYIPPLMALTTPGPIPTPTPLPTPTTAPTPTPDPDPGVTPTPEPTGSLTPTPAQAINLDNLTISIANWSPSTPTVQLGSVTNQMEYRIIVDSTHNDFWFSCNNGTMNLTVSPATSAFRIDVRQKTNTANQVGFSIRSAPQVRLVKGGQGNSVYVRFELFVTGYGWRGVLTEDKIQYYRSGGAWTTITTGLQVGVFKNNNPFSIRYSDGNDIIGVLRTDPPSLYIVLSVP